MTEPHGTMEPALEARAVTFRYQKERVLNDVSISIQRGEFFCIIGPNGSGKSTLLRILAGVLQPQSGSVFLNGVDMRSIPRNRIAGSIAVVPQIETMTFPFTVRSMVLFGRFPYQQGFGYESPEDHAIAHSAMERVGILHLADRSVTRVSGGEAHRVILARALAQDAPIMLLDEPNAHLDLRYQMDVFKLLHSLNQNDGRTIVCITHDLNLAAMYSDRVAVIAPDTSVLVGDPDTILTSDIIRSHFDVAVALCNGLHGGPPHVVPLSDINASD